ncbi:undecaprenyldiphospho-muramoylpentapeptide beta-N-acetylglucosaminyltransferase [Ructibacterium gallinarum]|uniref:UDP-N-acetylglucosamine--N-acetylmuramyl-(pentapeptide) pyrophosphoryl-undecaprenol N-acetylglucosamine transferase n=1 Tax=Ructibacterium gallinarum TaxID=2779355 RepID=A0A9D5M5Q7_9FIRM|nr:undecaprenyldiphospho-muramoylpentapeptide beta-N-acetylglucosaminyltransferase [Ructibacterium gallinarum]MBE5039962.1 undecaprenyldiphospho-muramoylpentapeptide beta-N-acetylglucosaminyltransferase [Ructibacterium gallinarum]
MRLLFAGGGTAGHINPALAVANYFCQHAADTQVRFVGTAEGLETGLVPRSGYPLDLIRVHGFDRSLTLQNLKNVCELPGAVIHAGKIIKKFRPDVVVGTGGYVAGPVLYAAARRHIPTLIHESNAFPGITTRILSRYVDTVALGVEDAGKYLSKAKNLVVTGTPLRPSLLAAGEFEARRKLELDDRPFLVIFGGSLGARDFNRTVVDWICQTAPLEKYQILMGTGKLHQYDDVMERFHQNGVDPSAWKQVKICEYIYDMDVVMRAADLVISRAGASTLCELTALGKPAVLVPSPYVTGNHQEHNARAVERGGGAKVILEKDFTPDVLEETVSQLTSDKKILIEMKKASRALGHINATEVLYQEIIKLVRAREASRK